MFSKYQSHYFAVLQEAACTWSVLDLSAGLSGAGTVAWNGTEPAWAITGLTDSTVAQGLAGIAAATGFHQGHILNSLLKQNSQWFQRCSEVSSVCCFFFFLLAYEIILNLYWRYAKGFKSTKRKIVLMDRLGHCGKRGITFTFLNICSLSAQRETGLPWGARLIFLVRNP